ncbi:MAG: hypothetical protein OCD00_03785 [Colwellia sp.]
MFDNNYIAISVFLLTLIVTFSLAALGRKKSNFLKEDDLAGKSLNKWLIGLSTGATANSGFIVSGAIGLGYIYGIQWLLLPISWFIGDLIFWKYFPDKINSYANKTESLTLTDILTKDLIGKNSKAITIITSIILALGLGGYIIAQWVAGQKFLAGAFNITESYSLLLFATVIIAYSSIGGFRGSVYVDTFQAILRLIGSVIILTYMGIEIFANLDSFISNISSTPESFFSIIGQMSIPSAIGFIAGWASASIGFGLAQPQVTMRYIAGESPEEVKKAKWIYIGYVQFTWLSMTIFGILLRGVMPDITDPEAGLAIFVSLTMPAILVGLIIADIFGVIASTANSLLVALAHAVKHDIGKFLPLDKVPVALLSILFGIATMFFTTVTTGTVASIAISAINFIAASLAGPVMIKLMQWKHNEVSLLIAMLTGAIISISWSVFGFSNIINEAAIGITLSVITNFIVWKLIIKKEDADYEYIK